MRSSPPWPQEGGSIHVQSCARRFLGGKKVRTLRMKEAVATASKLSRSLGRQSKLRHAEQHRQSEVNEAMKLVQKSEKTDLCFMLDATGSMSSQIEAVKTQIQQVVTDVSRTNPHLKLRLAVVGYRDRASNAGLNSPYDFTDSVEQFVSNVSQIAASGGGDMCEDVSSGLSDVLDFSWTSPTRVLFFIADAPAHGDCYHDGCGDNHPEGDHGVPGKLRQIKAMNVDVVFCKINDSTDKMIEQMNADVGEPTKGPSTYIQTVAMDDPRSLTSHATKALRKSMQKTLTSCLGAQGQGQAERERPLPMKADKPRWEVVPKLAAKVFTDKHVSIASLKADKHKTSAELVTHRASSAISWAASMLKTEEEEVPLREFASAACKVQIAPLPFAAGNVRFARYGRILDGTAAGDRVVVLKDFKAKAASEHALEKYLVEMEVNAVASALAAEFNKVCGPPPSRRMKYVGASVATVERAGRAHNYFVEELLEGEFTRYSYNTGYWEEDLLDEWLLRFALWTYEVTDGFLMVSDLQGVHRGRDGYTLTDPVILCEDLHRFGETNLGKEMMERCKESTTAHLEAMRGK